MILELLLQSVNLAKQIKNTSFGIDINATAGNIGGFAITQNAIIQVHAQARQTGLAMHKKSNIKKIFNNI